ncbi:MAG: FAD-dependent oxidoreductase [Deltaproteobacteria bacterium]|nr:FAD-dependent oxidoreductase [Deltaproteobacteria bacterium]
MASRRDALRWIVGAPLLARSLAACGGATPRAPHVQGELLGQSLDVGHRVRDLGQPGGPSLGDFRGAPEERVKLAIVGGGPAGLSAAWRLTRRGELDYQLFELESEVGGTSAWQETGVAPHPWGAHYLPLPMKENVELLGLLGELGALDGVDAMGEPMGSEEMLIREPEERVFYGGFWYPGLYPYAGASEDDLRQLRRFRAELDRWTRFHDAAGRRAFTIPRSLASDDAEVMALDRVSATDWLAQLGLNSPRLEWLVRYACRDDYGLEPHETSAWALVFYWASRTVKPGHDTRDLLAWPEGNGRLVKHLRRAAGDRIRTGRVVLNVEQSEGGVTLRMLDVTSGRPLIVHAERAILATPHFVTRKLLGLGAGELEMGYGSWVVANLHLESRPVERGFPLAWDNVPHGSEALGYVVATHQLDLDRGPSIFTWYRPLTGRDPADERRRMLDTSFEEWRDGVLTDLAIPHPDLGSRVRRLDVWRWGHAMPQPRVGLLSSASLRRAREARGRLHFAHTDLSGMALFEESFDHGLRAADELLAALAPPATSASAVEPT